ncbi:bifunctional phosphoribosylaminoimidazolecarboxamide formyltransferase/IMP cyclohydrolase [Helcobacillus massiliensis]|uniref:bifunctional phosphoribosylaminoimidazolecarboxamide formyltransferase/IMP cyclohydrolase n=1 Tax=Helcobacillus massiliensis TaxID=521392 RepID=UPI0021A90CAB|nr:bifunctional phosphoribosylaminoimidazolecarboxamide formyltransferase/IMP cyclohydrolase [Helcobacillus massiliensis]MCT1558336.1 bifunctional phosphoribosylaminoimidazolecarboxamide formyltransferase/IMP cyclohydrolase [Helcobacillus massiliensis]MCT2036562.1 bifunctional phosphoribosylaminoimidazolecarboxamide formyltransferase/IMP cyclohydrolase [Helcobacillus massiliensis]MCT2332335.1 bifunctional phosphoribosylaminoimidazolecarboxamide formyltransferase/IMP cyclohydrolase [Helcobacillus
MTTQRAIKRALISVFDKTGLEDLARALHGAGTEIVSTGSTAQAIRDAGLPVTDVADVTGFPEILDGRVKTLHPAVHGGLLADRTKESHEAALKEHGIAPFDLVVVNLYPFEQTVADGGAFEEIIEKIDIGGPAMVRSAAKNFSTCAVVVEQKDYALAADAAGRGGFTRAERYALSAVAFARIAMYDAAIDDWTQQQLADLGDELAGTELDLATISERYAPDSDGEDCDCCADGHDDALDGEVEEVSIFDMPAEQMEEIGMRALRYGENPHQRALLDTAGEDGSLASAEVLHGKEMSYNNYVDADAAIRAAFDFDQPAVAVIKHNNPCGVAVADDGEDIAIAHRKAHATDPVSAFGGVIAANRPVTVAMANQVAEVFTEVLVAPGYEDGALEILTRKKNIRLLEIDGQNSELGETRDIWGGTLIQEKDRFQADGDDPASWQLVAGDAADDATLADLAFAWRAVRAPKSNAILLAKDGGAVGIGMGQVNRVDSCRLAVERANTLADGEERARGSVCASDAFFPFADGPQQLIDAGITAIVQPGGSVRDQEVIDACTKAGVAMYVTGTRHFAH